MSQLMKCNEQLDEIFYNGHLIAKTNQENSRYTQRDRIFRKIIAEDTKAGRSNESQGEKL